jgi:sugar phosphate isomerase/epimerase
MKVGDHFHLTYCSNIHRGETWTDVSEALAASLPQLRAQLAFDGPMAVGLRLSAQAAETLEHPATLAAFREFLRRGDYYVLTMNGFPYGAFHGQRVKEQVYEPDWRERARVEYTNRLARLLSALLSDRPDIEGSVSTVPGAFRTKITSEADVDALAAGFLAHTAALVSIRERTGVTIALAIEPEPACYIETVAEAATFFTTRLFDPARVARAARDAGVSMTVDDVRRHVGVCFDACHAAVEFEDPSTAFALLRGAGVRICKVQVSSALRMARQGGAAMRAAFGPFADDTYLHQVVEQCADRLVKYTDLPDALAGADATGSAGACEWRVHFHVPVFLAAMKDFETTQPYLTSVLDLLKRDRACPYLEVETYTWDVLPPEYRTVDVTTAIARELMWTKAQLEA